MRVSWTFSAFALCKNQTSRDGPSNSHPCFPNGPASGLTALPLSHLLSPQPSLDTLSAPSGRASLDPGKGPRTSFQVNEGITLSLPISTDDASLNKITEKTHRVLRVVGEVKGEGTTKEGRGVGKGGGQDGDRERDGVVLGEGAEVNQPC